MYRFTRLAIGWLAIAGVAVLIVLQAAAARRSAGQSSTNNRGPDNGPTADLVTGPKPVALPVRRTTVNTPTQTAAPAADAEASGDEPAIADITRSVDLPCIGTGTQTPQLLPSTVTVGVTGGELGQSGWAGVSIDPSAIVSTPPSLTSTDPTLGHVLGATSQVVNQVEQAATNVLQDVPSQPVTIGLGAPTIEQC